MDDVAAALARDYATAAAAWSTGAAVVYDQLAEVLVDQLGPTGDGPVLDLCAGTGAVSRVLVRLGANTMALDLAPAMLRLARDVRPPAVVGHGLWLPFRSAAFAAVVVAFGLNHAADPVRFLAEAARTLQPGGTVLTSTFARAWSHPAKEAVDAQLQRLGFRAPAWHAVLKDEREPVTAEPDALQRVARAAGLLRVDVREIAVDLELTPAQAVAWRLSMASHAPFVAGLDPSEREQLRRAAERAVQQQWEPVRPRMLVLRAHV